MYPIPDAFIQGWTGDGPARRPVVVDTICPVCGMPVVYALDGWSAVGSQGLESTEASCARCDGVATFVFAPAHDAQPAEVYMSPAPRFLRRPLEGVESIPEFDDALKRAYAAAINVFNAREWIGTAVVCRRTLEDIAKAFLPEDRHTLSLALQIQALSKRRDLAEPVLALADTLKRSGNLSRYVDLETTPDEQAAAHIIELLDSLIEYLFILPERIHRLGESINELGDAGRGEGERPDGEEGTGEAGSG